MTINIDIYLYILYKIKKLINFIFFVMNMS
jgi:hypothetical protein